MTYTVNQLAKLAGISVRTLHYYDQIGLFKPASLRKNGYREYGEKELLVLQQILFFRELDFPVEEIKRIMSSPSFDMRLALRDHRAMIELKKKRLNRLIKTIDKTLHKLENNISMNEQDLKETYDTFGEDTVKKYAEEVKQRWGNTEAYKQSMERYAKTSKEDLEKYKKDADIFMKAVAEVADQGPLSVAMQEKIAQHFDALRTWYEPNFEMYRGLAKMYVDDPRFEAYYEKYKPGLAKIFSEAMLYYADQNEPKK
ncbi:MerR family transcriptional regulator [Candidatus Uhrbacteria bacterium]|nr:MerR family transcriptional regulator [Candidatus Uhrbacteria bacterium]